MNSPANKPTSTYPTMSMCLFLLPSFFPPNVNIGQFISTPKKNKKVISSFLHCYLCFFRLFPAISKRKKEKLKQIGLMKIRHRKLFLNSNSQFYALATFYLEGEFNKIILIRVHDNSTII